MSKISEVLPYATPALLHFEDVVYLSDKSRHKCHVSLHRDVSTVSIDLQVFSLGRAMFVIAENQR